MGCVDGMSEEAMAAPARAILEWSGHCRRQCIEARSADISAQSAGKIFSPSFSDVWMSSRSTLVLCTALSLISAFRVIRRRGKEMS